LLDPEQDVAVRRRIPQILAYTTSQRAVDGLTSALKDPRFEVRFNAGRALEFLHRMGEDLSFDQAKLMAMVERELSNPRAIWDNRKLVDTGGSRDLQYRYLDDVLRNRANKSLEYVFSLLAVLLPAEPLKVAFRALHSSDRMLHALALEFLESYLSSELVARLRQLVEPAPADPVTTARITHGVASEVISPQTVLRISQSQA
jgi:ATP:ADP antiporter, AAA family